MKLKINLEIMSNLTYIHTLNTSAKPIIWLRSEIKSPPLSKEARLEAGFLLRKLQIGENLSMPHSRPMPD